MTPRRVAPSARVLAGLAVACSFVHAARAAQLDPPADPEPDPPNVLLVVLDDVGARDLASYGLGTSVPNTPVLDDLAANGVRFSNVWSNPVCSPTRAGILTGRHPLRTLIGDTVLNNSLAFSELTIPELLPERYTSAAIGKWHLSAPAQGLLAPNKHGFDHFAGVWANIRAPETYYSFERIVDGVVGQVAGYATTIQVNDALSWITAQDDPWFCQLAFTAAHTPIQFPPANLYTQDVFASDRDKYLAIIEAADAELGRLLQSLDPQVLARTVVIVVGDNGTDSDVSPPALSNKAKNTVFEGGVHVPLIVTGPGVEAPGTRCDALVSTVDLFATVLELAGAPPAPGEHDSVSLVPYLHDPDRRALRELVFTQSFKPDGPQTPTKVKQAVRGARYKLMRNNGVERLYDLQDDPDEIVDLLGDPDLAAVEAGLRARLDAQLATPATAAATTPLSLAAAGERALAVVTSADLGGAPYLVLASGSGTSPGVALGPIALPLVPDAVMQAALEFPNGDVFVDTLGFLDAAGTAVAAFRAPGGADPSLAGLALSFATLVLDAAGGPPLLATKPVTFALAP